MTNDDRAFLDFLCAAFVQNCPVRVKPSLERTVRRLREAGLLSLHGYRPSPRAQAEWFDRRQAEQIRIFDAARTKPPVLELVSNNETKSAGAHSPTGPSETTVEGAAAPDLPDEAPPALEKKDELRPWVAPAPPPPEPLTKREIHAVRTSAGQKKALEREANRLLDAGKQPGHVQQGALRTIMKAIQGQREARERATSSIGSAKLFLQQRRIVVYSAEVTGGPKDKFVVGNALMSEEELLAYAGRLAQ